MDEKEYVSASSLVRDSFSLARRIYDSGFRPDVILVLWRGGTPVGIVVHEFLLYMGVETYHTVVKAESYTGIGRRGEPYIESLDRVLVRLQNDSHVLLVDDIFDSGRTLEQVCNVLKTRTNNIRVATLYVRQGHNQTDLRPDYFQCETNRWIVFPHELVGLTPEEIHRKDPFVANLLSQIHGP